MGLSINVRVTGLPEEIAKLNKFKDKLSDFGGAMKTIGDQVVRYYAGEGYASQGGVFGSAWPDLSPIYAKRKANLYPGHGILDATGTMKRSFESDPSSTGVVITNTAPYAIYHQSTDPRTIMPYRPIMAINDQVVSIVKQVLQDDIQEKLAAF